MENGVRVVPGIYDVLPPSGGVPDGTEGLNALERAAISLGLESPLKRAIFVGATVTAAVWAFQPAVSFSSGATRSSNDGGIPWIVWPIAAVVVTQFLL